MHVERGMDLKHSGVWATPGDTKLGRTVTSFRCAVSIQSVVAAVAVTPYAPQFVLQQPGQRTAAIYMTRLVCVYTVSKLAKLWLLGGREHGEAAAASSFVVQANV